MSFKKIINEIKTEWEKSKIKTGFMGVVLILAVLTYLKPGSTDSILKYLSLSAINFIALALVVLIIWWGWWRKR